MNCDNRPIEVNGMSLERMNAINIMEHLGVKSKDEKWYENEDKVTNMLIEVVDKNISKRVIEKSLQEILNVYTEKNGNPLDSIEIDILVEHLRNKLNLMQGNLTISEYEKLENEG